MKARLEFQEVQLCVLKSLRCLTRAIRRPVIVRGVALLNPSRHFWLRWQIFYHFTLTTKRLSNGKRELHDNFWSYESAANVARLHAYIHGDDFGKFFHLTKSTSVNCKGKFKRLIC